MKSKFLPLRNKAISLRKKGLSLRYIESELKIPRSTLSGWFKSVELTREQKDKLHNDWLNALIEARKKAVLVHNKGKNDRRQAIRSEIDEFIEEVNLDKKLQEVILATFYLAEGGKTENCFALANSNPEILKGVIALLRKTFTLDESKFRCCLHLRKDQNEETAKSFWSKTLKIPYNKFLKTQFDKRTIKKTYDNYLGVCVLYYFDLALQRRILYLGEKLLKIINRKGD